MCQTAVHTTQRKGSQQADRGSSLKLYRSSDPTRTLTLRRRYAREMRKRFRALRGLIRTAIVGRDVFGLSGQNNKLVAHQDIPRSQAFDFPRTQDKVSEFMEWLEQQVDAEILEVTDRRRIGQSIDQTWQNVYIEDTYKRGVQRATYEMDNAGFDIPDIEQRGGIGTVLSQPAHVDRLGVLYTRAFNELKGITDDMGQKISRVLAQGLADGDGPRLLARKLNKTIGGKISGDLGITDTLGRFIPAERRAEILARTEIIRAHHKGTMQTYRNWGAAGVSVKAEFRTAGDRRVCPQCYSLEGAVFTLDVAENMIPVHPMCRCIVLPARDQDIGDAKVIDDPQEVQRIVDDAARTGNTSIADIQNPDPANLSAFARTPKAFTSPDSIPTENITIEVADNLGDKVTIRRLGELTGDEESYLSWYSGDGFRQLNDYLRNPAAYADSPATVESLKKMAAGLNNAIEKRIVQQSFTTFRGVNSKKFTSFIDDMGDDLIGKELDVSAFQSTALDESIADTYAGFNGVKFRINVPEGSNVVNLMKEDLSREMIGEVVLPNRGKFIVRNISEGQRTGPGGKLFRTIIDVDYVQ